MKTPFIKRSIIFLLVMLTVLLAGTLTVSAATAKNGVVKDADGIRYYVNGTYRTGWQTIGGRQVYFFAATGLMCDYDRTIGGVYTDLEPFTFNGLTLHGKVKPKNGLVAEDGGVRYYVNGKYLTGWQTIGGKQIYFYSATGFMCTDHRTIGGVMTYFEPITIYAKTEIRNGLVAEDGGVRYYQNNTYLTGWQTIGDKQVYFFSGTGLMCDYDRTIGGEMTYFEPFEYNGITLYGKTAAKNGLYFEDGGIRYYKDNAYLTGWQTIGGKQVYFYAATGLMCTENRMIGGLYTEFEAFPYQIFALYAKKSALPSSEGLTYAEKADGTLKVTGIGTCTDTELIIPAAVNGKRVTEIGAYSFSGNTWLKKVIIPEGITTIGEYAFRNCRVLKSVTMPDTVTVIEEYAFYYCTSLSDVTLSDNLTQLGDYAFYMITTSPTTYKSTRYLGSRINPYLVLTGYTGNGADLEIHPDAKFITNFALRSVPELTELILPESIVSVGSGAFLNSTKLTKIHFPASTTHIGTNLFANCIRLTEVTVDPKNPVYHSQNNCLIDTQSKTLMACAPTSTIPDDGSVTTLGQNCFCSGMITKIVVPEGITKICSTAFGSCSALATVTLPQSLKIIEDRAFSYCTDLTTLNYRGSAEDWSKISIADNNSPLFNATVYYDYMRHGPAQTDDGIRFYKDGVTQTGWQTIGGKQVYFYAATGLMCTENRYIGGVYTKFTPFVYNGLTLYGKETVKNGVYPDSDGIRYYVSGTCQTGWQTIGDRQVYFFAATGLMCDYDRTISGEYTAFLPFTYENLTLYGKVYASDGLTYRENSNGTMTVTGSGTCKDTTVIIPAVKNGKKVTAIEAGAFAEHGLSEILIPDTVTSIGAAAFAGCTELTDVYYTGTADNWLKISIGSGNTPLLKSDRYVYSYCLPTVSGLFWRYINGKPVIWQYNSLSDGSLIYSQTFDLPNNNDTQSVLNSIGFQKLTKEADGAYNETDAEFAIIDGRLYYDNYDAEPIEGDTRIRGKDGYYLLTDLDEELMKQVCAGKYTLQYDLEYIDCNAYNRYATIATEFSPDSQCYNSFHFRIGGYANHQCHFYGSWKTYSAFDTAIDLNPASTAKTAEEAATKGTPIVKKLLGLYYDNENNPKAFQNIPVTIKLQWDPEMGHHVYMKTSTMADFIKVSEPSINADGPMYLAGWEGWNVVFKLGAAIDGYIDNIKLWTGWTHEPTSQHTIDSWTTVKEATCRESGVKAGTCTTCGKTFCAPVPKSGHLCRTWAQTVKPTCTAKGEETGICVHCGDSIPRTIDPLGHRHLTWTQTKAPSCQETGSSISYCENGCGTSLTVTLPIVNHQYVNDICTMCGKEKPNFAEGLLIYEQNFNSYANNNDTASVLNILGFQKLTKEKDGVYNETDAEFAIIDGRLYYDNYDAKPVEGDTRIRGKDGYYLLTDLDEELMKKVCNGKYTLQYDLQYIDAGNDLRYACMVTELSGDGQCYNQFRLCIRGTGTHQCHFYGAWKTYSAFDPVTDLNPTSTAKTAEEVATMGTPIVKKLLGLYYDNENNPKAFQNVHVTIKLQWDPEMGHHVYMKTASMTDFVKVSAPSINADGPMYLGWDGFSVALKLGATIDGYLDNIALWTGWGERPTGTPMVSVGDGHIHSYTKWTQTKAPTCTTAGTEISYCDNSNCNKSQTRSVDIIPHNNVNGKCSMCGIETSVFNEGTLLYVQNFNSYANNNDTASVLNAIGFQKLTKEKDGAYSETDAEFAIVNGRLYYDNYDAEPVEGDTRIRGKDGYYLLTDLDEELMKKVCRSKYTLQYDMEYIDCDKCNRYATIATEFSPDSQCYNSFHFRIGGYANHQCHFYGSWKTYSAFDPVTDLNPASTAKTAEEAAIKGTPIVKKLLGLYYDNENNPKAFQNVHVTIKLQWDPEMGHHVYMKTSTMADFIKISEPSVYADAPLYIGWSGYRIAFKLGAAIDGYIDNIALWTGWCEMPSGTPLVRS